MAPEQRADRGCPARLAIAGISAFRRVTGHGLRAVVAGEPDLIVVKHVNSAFYGSPDLHAWLQDHGHHALTICGITTNHCCEATPRMAGNLGYETTFAIDATHRLGGH